MRQLAGTEITDARAIPERDRAERATRRAARRRARLAAGPRREARILEPMHGHASSQATDARQSRSSAPIRSEQGRFHYAPDGHSLNFIRGRASLPVFLAAFASRKPQRSPFRWSSQGLLAERFVPGFADAHPMPLVPASAAPRLWIGNAAKVATHNDPIDNIAVVAAGRRRFTLFPPDAEADLYMGPAHPTPAGTPVSMVHVTAPDFDRYPRFARRSTARRKPSFRPATPSSFRATGSTTSRRSSASTCS